MKGFSSLLVIGLAASAEAARLPLCSAVCLTNGIAATGCKAIDTECICQSPEFMSAVTECVEERCSEDHKSTTLQTAESYCSAAGIHGQLKKREAAPEPVAEPEADPEADPEAWGDHGGFGLGWFRKGGGGRPHWGWGKGRPGPAVVKSPPWKWVPDFNKPGSEEWWKQQVAQWWRDNGYNWWRYNGWHFAPPKPKDSSPPPAPWWSHFDENWWQSNAGNWWHGPSGNQGQWHGPKPWWPTAPASTAPEPPPPTSTWTPTSTPTAQPWTDWIHTVTVTATATPSPTHTHTKPSWTPYTTSKPVQTVIPWKDW